MRVGIGSIGWVNSDIPEWGAGTEPDRILHEAKEAGFEGADMCPAFPEEPAKLRALFSRYDLALTGAFRWMNFASANRYESELEEGRAYIDWCLAAGTPIAVMAEGAGSLHWDKEGQRMSVERLDEGGWARVILGLEEMGRYARSRGATMCFHPHGGSPIETEDEIDRLMASTDPEIVPLGLDSGHVAYGGGDPVAVFRRYADRIRYVHAKDVRPHVLAEARREGLTFNEAVQRGVFCPPGSGSIDFPGIFAVLRSAGYDGWIIAEAEQDPAIHIPLTEAQRARRYLRDVARV